MPASAIASPAPAVDTRSSAPSRLPIVSLTLGLGTLWFVCCRHLSAEWSYNEQYSYGWFVPFFALYLFWLRWEDAPQSQSRIYPIVAIVAAICALLLLLPLRLVEVANPDWRPISWIHTLTAIALTLLLIWWIGGKPWLRHFAFPVLFVLVSVPWISAIEVPIIQGLMPMLASIATEALSLFGIPAEVQGNLVRINGGVVGINEACSGVRSLQTSLMIGLLFGELKRLSVFQRLLLIIGAIAIAFVANCGRAFFLVWIAAARGLTEVEKWHDIAGYTIVGLVFFGCLGMTAWLSRGAQRSEVSSHKSEIENETEPTGTTLAPHSVDNFGFPRLRFLVAAFVWLVAIEIAVEAWYRAHEQNLPKTAQWSVRWPKSASGFREVPIDERTRSILHFDKGHGATWRNQTGQTTDIASAAIGNAISLLYFFRWEPGHNSALLANAHRPDVCLPSTGWRQTEDLGVREYRVSPSLSVPFRHFVFIHDGGGRQQYAHAFYCVSEDRVRRDSSANPSSGMSGERSRATWKARLTAVQEGRRHLGQQVLEYLCLDQREVGGPEAEQRFGDQVTRLIAPQS